MRFPGLEKVMDSRKNGLCNGKVTEFQFLVQTTTITILFVSLPTLHYHTLVTYIDTGISEF